MKKVAFLIIAIAWLGCLSANDLVSRAQKAMTLFEAGEYDSACNVYESLLKESLTPNQRFSVDVNIGSVLVAKGNSKEAIDYYNKISVPVDPSPQVWRSMEMNKAMARFNQGVVQYNNLDDKEEDFAKQCDGIVENLSIALIDVDEALAVDSQIAMMEGREDEQPMEAIVKIRDGVKMLMVQVLKRKQDHWMANLKEDQGLPLLMRQLKNSIAGLELLADRNLNKDILVEYLNNMAIMAHQDKTIWEKLRQVYLKAREDALQQAQNTEDVAVITAQNKEALFSVTENKYLSSLDYMKEGKLWQARTSQAVALVPLTVLTRMVEHNDPLEGLLIDRIAVRQRIEDARMKNPLYESSVIEIRALSNFGLELIPVLKKGYSFDDDEEHVSAKMLDELARSLTNTNVCIAENNRVPQLSSMRADLILYRQINVKETDTLISLLKTLYKGHVSADKKEEIFEKIEALIVKFKARYNISEDEEVRYKINEILDLLQASMMIEYKDKEFSELDDYLQKVLSVWDLNGFIVFKLQTLLENYQAVDVLTMPKVDALLARTQLFADEFKLLNIDLLEPALDDLLYCQQKVVEKKNNSACFYLDGAAAYVKSSLEEYQQGEELSLAQKLEKAISYEEQCIDFTGRLQQIIYQEGLSDYMIAIPLRSQSDALKVVNIKEEEVSEDIVKLIDQGKHAANDVPQYLNLTIPECDNALNKEKQVKKFWEEALEKLKGNDNDEQQQEQNNNEQQQNSLGSASQDVLEIYQTMEVEDKQTNNDYAVPVKKGLRPW